MFQSSRRRLLSYYAIAMIAILVVFSTLLYWLYSLSLDHNQLNAKLETLAKIAAPAFVRIYKGDPIDWQNREELPWRDFFDAENQSLEWFDSEGKLLAHQGHKFQLGFSPESSKGGFCNLQGAPALKDYHIRTYTLFISIDRSSLSLPPLTGYVRTSETSERLQELQKEFLHQLVLGILVAFIIVAITGRWLTKKALEPAEKSYQQLKQFTADASHELRNPLTVMRTALDVLRNHPERLEARDLKKINSIANAAEQMTHLTQDLLLLARTDAIKDINPEQWQLIDLSLLLEDLGDWLEPMAASKKIQLEYQNLGEVSLWGDINQLSRLFSNLVENAIQYTPEGGKVIVSVQQENQKAIVTVEDTGIGISKEQLKLVFERFWRSDAARTLRKTGTGLGLAIVKAIANAHGGEIQVSSQVGKGTCFQVCLPLHPQERTSPRQQFLGQKNRIYRFYRLIFSKKIAIVLLIILLSLLPIGIIWETWRQTAIFQGVYFADRARAFADEIVKEKKLSPDNALAVLGIPNSRRSGFLFFFNSHPNDLILQPGQEITVRFIDNLLTGSGDTQPDLQIFGQGNINTPIRVEISKDRSQWLSLGEISPSAAIDIDRFGVRKEDFFAYVRLIYPDLGSNTLASPVYIDAIGAISSVSLDNLPNREQLIYNPVLYPLFIAFLVIALIYCLLKRFKLPLTPSDP
jgi:two-component system, OmpR family, manganese sensing sensor histidine kinase